MGRTIGGLGPVWVGPGAKFRIFLGMVRNVTQRPWDYDLGVWGEAKRFIWGFRFRFGFDSPRAQDRYYLRKALFF